MQHVNLLIWSKQKMRWQVFKIAQLKWWGWLDSSMSNLQFQNVSGWCCCTQPANQNTWDEASCSSQPMDDHPMALPSIAELELFDGPNQLVETLSKRCHWCMNSPQSPLLVVPGISLVNRSARFVLLDSNAIQSAPETQSSSAKWQQISKCFFLKVEVGTVALVTTDWLSQKHWQGPTRGCQTCGVCSATRESFHQQF